MSEAQRELLTEKARRSTQETALLSVMLPLTVATAGAWYTLAELVALLESRFKMQASEAGVSARLRGIRGMGYQVDRQKRSAHHYAYRCWSQS